MRKKETMLRWKRYLEVEAGIEFKACLYFFCMLAFYCIYRMIQGCFEASILHMTEMILSTYVMGYIQYYLLSNFDEAEKFSKRTVVYSVLCSIIYMLIAYVGNWFDGNNIVLGIFYAYLVLAYFCAFLVYKVKREADTRKLNEELKAFQERRCGNGEQRD